MSVESATDASGDVLEIVIVPPPVTVPVWTRVKLSDTWLELVCCNVLVTDLQPVIPNNQLKVKITNSGILEGLSDAEIKTSPIRKHSNTISTNTTIDSSENAIASGPISVATGVTLTINGNMTVV